MDKSNRGKASAIFLLVLFDAWKVVNLACKTKGRPANMGRILPPQLYDGPCNINPLKHKDHISILEYVPPVHHSFYHSLNAEDDHASEDSDMES